MGVFLVVRRFQLGGDLLHFFSIDLEVLSIVGHKSVDLVLHVGQLRVDGTRKSCLGGWQDLVSVQCGDRLLQIRLALEFAIAVNVCGVEYMTVNAERVAPEFG